MAIALSGGSTNFTSTIEASPSANRTVTVPDTSFTVAGTDVAQTFSAAQTFSSDITLNAQKDVRFADSDSSNWVAFQAPATISSNVTWTLPATDGTSNQALVTNGSGTLSWATASASPGGSTTQLQYNNAGAFGGISGVTSDGTRITASTTIGVGGATPSTSGSGITFPATASASSDANTLDDYEEGTFTATLTGGTTNPTTAVTSTSAYTKVGNVVNFKISFENVTTTGAAGQIRITGLPFTPANGYRVISPCLFFNIATFTGAPIGMIDNNLTTIYFYASASNAAWSDVTHNAGATRYLSVSGFYTV
jgi:hypothetical protein